KWLLRADLEIVASFHVTDNSSGPQGEDVIYSLVSPMDDVDKDPARTICKWFSRSTDFSHSSLNDVTNPACSFRMDGRLVFVGSVDFLPPKANVNLEDECGSDCYRSFAIIMYPGS